MAGVARPRIAIVSREVWPFFTGGGIGRHVRATGLLLSEVADLTIVLPEFYRDRLSPEDPRLVPGARYAYAPEADHADPRPFTSIYHAWSGTVCELLRSLYPDGGPDLVEFIDFTGEGAVTVQAKRSGDRAFRSTRIVVSLHGTDEIHRVLNGQGLREPEPASLTSLERLSLVGADTIFEPGGDVYETYRRFYGQQALAPARSVAPPFTAAGRRQPPAAGDGRVRLLHVGRLERRKGVDELVRAVASLERDDFTLTLLGRDTLTGPAGGSMREHCQRILDGDPRVALAGQVAHEEVLDAIAAHDVVVVSSRWECFANASREALMLGRPVLATPTGGLLRIVRDGQNGWLAEGTGAEALAAAITRVLDDRDGRERMIGSEAVSESIRASVSGEETLRAYLEEAGTEAAPAPGEPPSLGVAVVGGAPEDGRLPAGELVALVDAGSELAPDFARRCAEAFAAAPKAAYVTCWSDSPDPWRARPLGNGVPLVEERDCGGELLVVRRADAPRALARVAAPELAGAGAWLLARELRAEGRHGIVVPERLARVPARDGRPGDDARRNEVEGALRRERVQWTAPL
jgi:glycosyltransferase involved in cell wall biosynthesis